MNLVKYLRKNNRKIMAIVVVLIMVAFIMPQVISQWARPSGAIKGSKAIATYGVGGTLSNDDLANARGELAILATLQAADFLRSQASITRNSPDMPSLLLSQLLWPDPRIAPQISDEIKRTARQEELPITDSQVNAFFEAQSQEKPEVIWLLLKNEARNVGFAVSTQDAGKVLASIVPQLTERQGKQAKAEDLIKYIMESQGVEQKVVLQSFADLLAVMQFSKSVILNEDVTIDQIKYEVVQQMQTLDMNAVVIRAADFTEKVPAPTADQIQKQFEQYKKFMPREYGPDNQFGFGYKQPARVQVEWAMVDMTDVKKLIQSPTPEQVEEYYQRNLEQYKEKVKQDPNDPNSKEIERTKSFAEVASDIARQLLQTRIKDRGEAIMTEFKETADAKLAGTDIEKLGAGELEKLAAKYDQVAEEVGKKYNVKIHVGKTGMISAEDVGRSEYLSRMFISSQSDSPTRLSKVLFSVAGLDAAKLGPFEIAKPRLFETVGPVKDYAGAVEAAVRVTAFSKPEVPASVDLKIAKKLPTMKEGKIVESNDVYVLSESVSSDIKSLAAFELAKAAAQKLEQGAFDASLAALNKEMGSKDANDAKFKLQPLSGLKRVSSQEVLFAARRSHDEPGQATFANMYQQQKSFLDRMFALAEDVKSGKSKTPQLVEEKGGMTVYVVRTMSLSPVAKDMYEQLKPRIAFFESYKQLQSLGLEFFRVDHILKRLNFKWDEKYRSMPVQAPELPADDVI